MNYYAMGIPRRFRTIYTLPVCLVFMGYLGIKQLSLTSDTKMTSLPREENEAPHIEAEEIVKIAPHIEAEETVKTTPHIKEIEIIKIFPPVERQKSFSEIQDIKISPPVERQKSLFEIQNIKCPESLLPSDESGRVHRLPSVIIIGAMKSGTGN